MHVTFYKSNYLGGIIVDIVGGPEVHTLQQLNIGFDECPKLKLSRDGTGCEYPLWKSSAHKCKPVFTSHKDADAYIAGLRAQLTEWAEAHGYKVKK